MRYREERPFEEIAQILGVPVGTAKSLVFRAKAELRRNLSATDMRCDEADALIDAFAEDALDGAERAFVAEHVAACERCRLAVDASRRLSSAIAALPSPQPSAAADARVLAAVAEERAYEVFRARNRHRLAALAGAAVVAAATVVVVASDQRRLARGPSRVPRPRRCSLDAYEGLPELGRAFPAIVAAVFACAAIVAVERAFAVRPRVR